MNIAEKPLKRQEIVEASESKKLENKELSLLKETTNKNNHFNRLLLQQEKIINEKSNQNFDSKVIKFFKKWIKDLFQAARFQYWLIKKQFFRIAVIFIVFAILVISIFVISLLPSLTSQFKKQLLQGYEPFVGHVSYQRSQALDQKINLVDNYLSYEKKLPANSDFMNYKGYKILNNFHLFANSDLISKTVLPSFAPKYSNETVTGQTFATYNYDIKPESVIKEVSDSDAEKYKKQHNGWRVGQGRTIKDNSQYIYNESAPNSLNLYELFATNNFVNNVEKDGEKYSGFNAFWTNGSAHNQDIKKISDAVINIYGSFDSTIAISGVGGLSINNFMISEITYLDGVSYLLKKCYNSPFAYFLARKTSSAIAGLLLKKGAVLDNPNGHRVFDRYVKNEDININLLFSSFLADIVNFFTPKFVGDPILTAAKKIKNNFSDVEKQIENLEKSNSVVIIDRKLWIANLIKNAKFNAGKSYSFNFGSLPYDPKTDELYTHLFDTKTDNGKNVSFDGYRDNSRFWGIHKSAQENLFQNGAFSSFSQNSGLSTGFNSGSPIPVVINKSSYYDHHNWRVNSIFKLTTKKICYKIKDESSTKNAKLGLFEVPLYCKVVGITNNYGADEVYTSREEVNNYIFQRICNKYNPQTHKFVIQMENDNYAKSIYIYGIPSQIDPRGLNNFSANVTPKMLNYERNHAVNQFPDDDKNNAGGSAVGYSIQPSEINNDSENRKSSNINSAIYGDGFGYFNSVNFTSNKSIDAVNSVIVDFTGTKGANNFEIQNIGSVIFVSANIFSKSLLEAAVRSIIEFLLIIFIIGSGLIFIVILMMFILSQKIFIEQNKHSFKMLKLLGYSTRNILLSTTTFYLITGAVLCVSVVVSYKFFVNVLFLLVEKIIPSALPIKFNSLGFSIVSLTIFIGLIACFYLIFLFTSLNTIRKIKCIQNN